MGQGSEDHEAQGLDLRWHRSYSHVRAEQIGKESWVQFSFQLDSQWREGGLGCCSLAYGPEAVTEMGRKSAKLAILEIRTRDAKRKKNLT